MRHAGIYAGTFDPITLGHVDVVKRAAHIFDKLIIAVVVKPQKAATFTVEERLAMVRESVKQIKNVAVDSFDGLLIDYARSKAVHVLVRGLRAYSDFEYEFQMALMNRRMAPEIETVFLMTNEKHSIISSTSVRNLAQLGADISRFVPECVCRRVRQRHGAAGRRR